MLRQVTKVLAWNCASQPLSHFVERPYTPNQWTSMTIAHLRGQASQELVASIMHNLKLMRGGVVPFSYDFYRWSCARVIEQQEIISKEQIFTLVKMGIEYRISWDNFQKHIENEIFLRVHRDYHVQITQYDQNMAEEQAKFMKDLEQKSKDYFELLNEADEIEQELKEQEEQADKEKEEHLTTKPSKQHRTNMRQKSKVKGKGKNNSQKRVNVTQPMQVKPRQQGKQFTPADLFSLSELLCRSNSTNLPLLQYLLQLLTIQVESNPSLPATEIVSYLQLTVHTCQSQMQQYHTSKKQYTSRSIKSIYKYQFFYMYEHIRQLIQGAQSLSNQQIGEIIDLYGAFPIKRRAIRRSIGEIVGSEINQRQLSSEIRHKLVNLNKKDNKMKKIYRQKLGLPEPFTEQKPKEQLTQKIEGKEEQSTKQQNEGARRVQEQI